VARDTAGGVGSAEEASGGVYKLLTVTSEHHVERDDEEERSEQLPEQMPFDASGDDCADGSANEEPDREKSGDREVHMPCAIVSERRKEPDRGKWNSERGSLCLML
jgi:hypothetical protein